MVPLRCYSFQHRDVEGFFRNPKLKIRVQRKKYEHFVYNINGNRFNDLGWSDFEKSGMYQTPLASTAGPILP